MNWVGIKPILLVLLISIPITFVFWQLGVFIFLIFLLQFIFYNQKELAIDKEKIIFPYWKTLPHVLNTFRFIRSINTQSPHYYPCYTIEKKNIKEMRVVTSTFEKPFLILGGASWSKRLISEYHSIKNKKALLIKFKKPLTLDKGLHLWDKLPAQEIDHVCIAARNPEDLIRLIKK